MSVTRLALASVSGPVPSRTRSEDGVPGEPKNAVSNAIDTVAKWIPGDVLALYVAGVTIVGQPSVSLLIAFVVVTPLYFIAIAYSKSEQLTFRGTVVPALLAMGAAAIWSMTVPSSGWQRSVFIKDNSAVVAVIAAFLALLFGRFADGVVRRLNVSVNDV